MNAVWTLYNVIILGVSCAVALEAKQLRTRVRINLKVPVILGLPDGRQLQVETTDLSSTGIALRTPRGLKIVPDDKVSVRFAFRFAQHDIPASVVGKETGRLRLQFLPLSLAQEEELTRVLYSRADSWLSAAAERERDRPLKSLGLLAKLSVRGVGAALSNFRSGGKEEEKEDTEKEEEPVVAEKTPESANTNSMAGTAVLLLGAMCLFATFARAAAPRQAPAVQAPAVKGLKGGAKPPTAAPTASRVSSAGAAPAAAASSAPAVTQNVSHTEPAGQDVFHTTTQLGSLNSTQPIVLRGKQSRFSLRLLLPSSQVVTTATMVMRYRLAPQLADQLSRVNLVINGVSAASVPLQRSPDEHSDQEVAISIPTELLVTDNSVEFQLAGVCAGADCGAASVTTLIQPDSKLELFGQRLALASDLALLPAPFLDPTAEIPSIPFAFLASPDPKTLRAAAVLASWFGALGDSRGLRFPVTLDRIPEGNAVLVGPAKNLPDAMGLGQVDAPTVAVRANPTDPYSKLLVITGANEDQVLQAASKLALGKAKGSGDTMNIPLPYNDPPARSANDAPLWLTGDRASTFGESYSDDQLVLDGFTLRTLYFRLSPDLYFGNRGSIPLHLTFRVDGLQPQQRTELNLYLNSIPVARIVVSADETPTNMPPWCCRSRLCSPIPTHCYSPGEPMAGPTPAKIQRSISCATPPSRLKESPTSARCPSSNASPKRATLSRVTRTFRTPRSSWGTIRRREYWARISTWQATSVRRPGIPRYALKPPRHPKWDHSQIKTSSCWGGFGHGTAKPRGRQFSREYFAEWHAPERRGQLVDAVAALNLESEGPNTPIHRGYARSRSRSARIHRRIPVSNWRQPQRRSHLRARRCSA